ncbi:hypothetical protein OHA51_46010 [Streptomyces sp. NBC_00589]|nr:hypothetical protein [Streptomyces sp. NBC_00589]WTI42989.1 hypothetical protein OIC96_03720 [Streptomyces sp. NBC_00775]WUB33384.1 hypothetical protein OHA51_46010 [Streptomyces sp. NBC_00589]
MTPSTVRPVPRAARGRGRAGAQLAPAACYFGRDAPDRDILHADELRAAEAAGAVSPRPAFSAAPADGVAFALSDLIASGRHVEDVYAAGQAVSVCGPTWQSGPTDD